MLSCNMVIALLQQNCPLKDLREHSICSSTLRIVALWGQVRSFVLDRSESLYQIQMLQDRPILSRHVNQ